MSTNGLVAFAAAESEAFDRDLAVAGVVLTELANHYRCRFLTTAGKGWPGRSVRKRVGFRTFVLAIRLNAAYLRDQRVFYESAAQWSLQYGELLTRVLRHEVVDSFTREEMHDEVRLRSSFSRMLEEHLGRR